MSEVRSGARPRDALESAFGSWAALLDRLPVGVYVCDAEGLITHYNPRAAELWGRAPKALDPSVRFCGAHLAFDLKGRPLALTDAPLAQVLRTEAPVRDLQLIIQRPDGSRRRILANAEPLFEADGRLAGAVNCVQDVTELQEARDRLYEQRNWSRQVLETSPIATYSTDARGRILAYNQAAEALWGRKPEIGVDRWCGSKRLFHPDGRPMPLDTCPMALTIERRKQVPGEAIFERPDGSRGAFLAYPTPLFGADGSLVGALNLLVDISGRKAAEDLQKALLDELNHRVKNTLATVQSLATHSFQGPGDPEAMLGNFEARLMALSCVHNQLAARNWEAAELGDIATRVLAPYGEFGDRLTARGPRAELSAREAVTLAMNLHELATNAVKYGALSRPGGRVDVLWEIAPDGGLALTWNESCAFEVREPERRGFGLRFVKGAVEREFAGRVDFDFRPQGLSCRICAPLSRARPDPAETPVA